MTKMNDLNKYDIAVIGAGASGLLAAYTAAKAQKTRNGKSSVILLEGNNKIGKKLLATGNGKCNLSNTTLDKSSYFGDTGSLPDNMLSYENIKSTFKELGIQLYTDDSGRVYPLSRQAASVVEILGNACKAQGVIIELNSVVEEISINKKFRIKIKEKENDIYSEALILATGGKASPKFQCALNGYDIAKKFGHSVNHLSPALVQMTSNYEKLHYIDGVRAPGLVKLIANGTQIASEFGEIQFIQKGVSGICIFNLSSYIQEPVHKDEYCLFIDFLPNMSEKEVVQMIKIYADSYPDAEADTILYGIINMKLSHIISDRSGISGLKKCRYMHDNDIIDLVKTVKNFAINITGLKGFEDAQITAGGVPVGEVNMETMQSIFQNKLFLCGEILDINGLCGGYNLSFAWLTGKRAGYYAAESLMKGI
jgi:predicted Rossmann fold flavoprotein